MSLNETTKLSIEQTGTKREEETILHQERAIFKDSKSKGVNQGVSGVNNAHWLSQRAGNDRLGKHSNKFGGNKFTNGSHQSSGGLAHQGKSQSYALRDNYDMLKSINTNKMQHQYIQNLQRANMTLKCKIKEMSETMRGANG